MRQEITNLSFLDGLRRAAEVLTRSELINFATLLWASWTSRNNAIHDPAPHDHVSLAAGFIKYVQDYTLYASKVFGRCVQRDVESATAWHCPPDGVIKINVDAAIMSGNVVRLGAAVRDFTGKLLLTAARRLAGGCDPSIAEAAAACFGVEIARRFSYANVWLECDSLGVVQKIRSLKEGFSHVYLFIDRVRNSIPLFEFFYCSHVKSRNTVAHYIARLCPSDVMELVSFEPFSQGVLTLVELDTT